MERVEPEACGLADPLLADEFVGRETLQCLEPAAEVVSSDEVIKMPLELGVIVVVVTLHGGILDGSVHPLDLSVCPRVHRLGQSMFDVEIGASRIKCVATEEDTLGPHRLDVCGRPATAGGVGEVRAVVRQSGVDFVRNGFSQVTKEVGCDPTRRLPVQLDEGELRGPVDGDQEIELAFSSLHLGDVNVEEADRIELGNL